MGLLNSIRGNVGYALGVRRYLRRRVDPEEAFGLIGRRLAVRDQSFLRLVERAVYARPENPLARLLAGARVGPDDLARMIDQGGLEATLHRLYDAGVFVTSEEFKGRKLVQRPGVEFQAKAADFDNPLLSAAYSGRTSGSTGVRRRVLIDFDNLDQETPYVSMFLRAHAVNGRPIAIWRPAPPDSSGLNGVFRYTKVGQTPEKWFSQTRFLPSAESLRAALFTRGTLLTARIAGYSLPMPEFVPRDDALTVARWLADKTRRATPAYVDTSASAATRICLAAKEAGLDIAGTAFRVGGEPFTAAKAAVFESVGARGINRYSMAETGIIGVGCAAPARFDDLHMATDKVAVIQRQKQVAADGTSVGALVYTSIAAGSRTLLLNLESGDYADLEQRECACPFGKVGFHTLISGLRSYDKLTSEGVTFAGSALYDLVETILPGRFGGNPTDYQLVEEEENGLARVSVIVAPGVGAVDDADVVATVLQTLGSQPKGGAVMADQWRQGATLRVLRREPYASGSRKILPLFVLRAADEAAGRPKR